MKVSEIRLLKIAIAILSVLMVLMFGLYVFFLMPRTIGSEGSDGSAAKVRHYHVLVVGEAENESFLRQIYEGAQSVSDDFDAVVELHVPSSYAVYESLQALFQYASFTNADGIITCMGEGHEGIRVPHNRNGVPIPLITLAQYYSNIPQVAYIGTNYSELGRKIAQESVMYLHERGRLVIINTTADNNPNYSTFMNSLTNTLAGYKDIHTDVLDLASSAELNSSNEAIRRHLRNSLDLLVCLTTEDTIRVAQLVTDMRKEGTVGIIGFGGGDVLETYLNKGTVTELLSIDSEKMGQTAMAELFEYLRDGYANNYITADVRVSKAAAQ